MEFLNNIPVMEEVCSQRAKKRVLILGLKNFPRAYGDAIEGFFDPLLFFLIWLEKLLVSSPWPIVIGSFAFLHGLVLEVLNLLLEL
jgi:glycine betaine/proline transport system permease protein